MTRSFKDGYDLLIPFPPLPSPPSREPVMSSGERVSISGAHRGAGRVSCACFIKINRSNSTHACTRHTHALLRPRARLNERETAQPQPTRSRTPHPSHTSAPLESSGAPQPLTRLCVSTMAACALRAVTRAPVTRCRPREARQSVSVWVCVLLACVLPSAHLHASG